MIRDDLLKGPADESAAAALARMREFSDALRDQTDRVHHVDYRPAGLHSLAEVERRLGVTLPPSYMRLLSDHGLPCIGPLLFEPQQLRRGDHCVYDPEDLSHVTDEELAAVMDRLEASVAFSQPDPGAYNYVMFRTDLVNEDGEMPVSLYEYDEVYEDPEDFVTFDQYVSAYVDEWNAGQAEDHV
ncbi:SMI1/KNR4 family protein [Priestia megaterium]|uniref:SMI1/KNR4 family protein n=1 Tax=Priestia megaterium TaxID=1404 RepID=UPI0036DEBEB0